MPEGRREAIGVVRYPPGNTLPLGSSLTLNFLRFTSVETGGVVSLRNWEIFQGVLVSFHFAEGGRQRITGSGVMVGPGIMLGATHVIAPEAPRMQSGEIGGIVTAITPNGVMLWHPQHIVADPSSDISIITASCASDLPPGNILPVAAMSSRLPTIGEKITIAGFRPGVAEFPHTQTGDVFSGGVYVSTGRVTQVFPNGRDRSMMPWPSIEVDCYTLGAMSGGPAFNEAGRLIGVLASSVETTEQSGPSYISLLTPALPLLFRPVWPVRASADICLAQRISRLWELE